MQPARNVVVAIANSTKSWRIGTFEQLWNFVLPYDPTILTATGHSIPTAGFEKKAWAKVHFDTLRVFTCEDGKDKINLIEPENIHKSILVDDRAKAIDPWREAGGIGIFHTIASASIRQLKTYLEKDND